MQAAGWEQTSISVMAVFAQTLPLFMMQLQHPSSAVPTLPSSSYRQNDQSIPQPASASQTHNLLHPYLPDIHSVFGTSLGALGCSGFPTKHERLAKDEIRCTGWGGSKEEYS